MGSIPPSSAPSVGGSSIITIASLFSLINIYTKCKCDGRLVGPAGELHIPPGHKKRTHRAPHLVSHQLGAPPPNCSHIYIYIYIPIYIGAPLSGTNHRNHIGWSMGGVVRGRHYDGWSASKENASHKLAWRL